MWVGHQSMDSTTRRLLDRLQRLSVALGRQEKRYAADDCDDGFSCFSV